MTASLAGITKGNSLLTDPVNRSLCVIMWQLQGAMEPGANT